MDTPWDAGQWGSSVVVADPAAVQAKLRKLRLGGHANLQVIADFDRTLAPYKVDGIEVPPSHGVAERIMMNDPEFASVVTGLLQKYLPLERDLSLDHATKYTYMVQWWEQTHEAYIRARINKEMLPLMVKKTPVPLREGGKEMFECLTRNGVPILVFSAGLGDIIQEILLTHGVTGPHAPNVHVVSNFMKFDEDGYLVGFEGALIHSLNKNEAAIHTTPYAAEVEARHNIVLLGDSLTDIQMSEGVQHETILRVGYLNDEVSSRLAKYTQAFDVVLLGDGGLEVVNSMLDYIGGDMSQ